MKEKKKIKVKRLAKWGMLKILLYIATIILFFVYFVLFFHYSSSLSTGQFFLIILLGCGNIALNLYLLFFCLSTCTTYTDEYEKLKEKYLQKGLLVVDDEDLPFQNKCGDKDWHDQNICSVTKEPLTSKDYAWCSEPKNCMKCAKFLRAVGYSEETIESKKQNGEIEKW